LTELTEFFQINGIEMQMERSIDLLLKEIVGLAMKVHRTLGNGFIESVYVNSLSLELAKANIPFECERKIPVFYDGRVVGDFAADMIIAGKIIVEFKAVESLVTAHSVQLVNYLTATRIDNGLLLNFGTRSLQFKTKTREYDKSLGISIDFSPISLIPS
jgi:GxxExxY protein